MSENSWVTATVVGNSQISPNMQRVVLQSKEFRKISADCVGEAVKLLFRPDLGTDLKKLQEGEVPFKRPYTISDLDQEEGLIELLIVRHKNQTQQSGFGSFWAQYAKPGSEISLIPVTKEKRPPQDADWYFFIGDMTAMAAIEAKLGQLPADAKGYALIQVKSQEDTYQITAPSGIEIEWLVADEPDDLYYDAKTKTWLKGDPFVWVGCEYELMLDLRRYFAQTRQVARNRRDISGYWRRETFHHNFQKIRHQDIAENN